MQYVWKCSSSRFIAFCSRNSGRIETTNGTHWCMPTTLIAAHTTNTNGGNCDELSQQGATQVVSWLPRGYERVAPRACTSSPSGHPQGPERAPCWVNPSLSGSLRHLGSGGQLDLQARARPLVSGQSEGWDQARGRKEVNWDPAFVRAKPLQSVEWTLPDFSDRDFVILKVRSWDFQRSNEHFVWSQVISYLCPVDESCAS